MKISAVIRELKSFPTKNTKAVAERRGVPEETLLGVSTADIRRLAKKLGQDDALADQLWQKSIHEARLLAILVAPLAEKSGDQLTAWAFGIDSWGLSDQFAKRLSENLATVTHLVAPWIQEDALYVKRAGLALIANHCMKQHHLDDETSRAFVLLIEAASKDDRQHVKQACCWALRELGKIDTRNHEIATELALELLEATDAARVWVGSCAYKELELLVKIPERRRLISRKSKTARKYHS